MVRHVLILFALSKSVVSELRLRTLSPIEIPERMIDLLILTKICGLIFCLNEMCTDILLQFEKAIFKVAGLCLLY